MGKAKRPIVLAMVGDTHMGSPTGLLPPQGFELDEGNTVLPNAVQRWMWDEVWLPYWQWIGGLAKEHHADLYGLINGDALDRHALARLLTEDPEDLAYIAEEAFGPVLELPFKEFYVIRGTASHVGGESATLEEMMARTLSQRGLPVKRWGNQWTAWEVALNFYGVRAQVAHHGRVGGKEHTRQSNAVGWAVDMANLYRTHGEDPPNLVVRAHAHQFADSGSSLINPTRYTVLPPLQLKNSFAHKVSANRPQHLCEVGGLAAVFYPAGWYVLHAFLRRPELTAHTVRVA